MLMRQMLLGARLQLLLHQQQLLLLLLQLSRTRNSDIDGYIRCNGSYYRGTSNERSFYLAQQVQTRNHKQHTCMHLADIGKYRNLPTHNSQSGTVYGVGFCYPPPDERLRKERVKHPTPRLFGRHAASHNASLRRMAWHTCPGKTRSAPRALAVHSILICYNSRI